MNPKIKEIKARKANEINKLITHCKKQIEKDFNVEEHQLVLNIINDNRTLHNQLTKLKTELIRILFKGGN